MIDYGTSPAVNEIEVTLFGPGYGEALAVHLGSGAWLLVDSCIDPDANEPASAAYLQQIGVHAAQVRSIVASHWHDDHVGGMSRLAAAYPTAEFVVSTVFNDTEALAFLAAYSGASTFKLSRGTTELHRVIRGRKEVYFVLHRSIVLEDTLAGRPVRVTAISPLPSAFGRFLAHVAQYKAHKDAPITHIPDLHPNFEAVALHIDFGNDAVLLGSDLEEHSKFGWSAVLADQWSSNRRPATAYKIAHHGSSTGDHPGIWETLLQSEPLTCLAPYTLAGRRLPTDVDKQRVRSRTRKAFISSGATRRAQMDSHQLKRLGDICKNIGRADGGFGAVRLRKPTGESSWTVELFGQATAL